jgi:hypothetical protein
MRLDLHMIFKTTMLKGQDLSYFEDHLKRREDADDSEILDNKLIELLLRDIGRAKVFYEARVGFKYES